MKTIIANKLMEYGLKPYLSGFNYLITALEIILKNDCNKLYIMKEIYPEVAKVHHTTISRVERNIRHAINTLDVAQSYYFSITHLTNGEFLYYVAYQLIGQDNIKELL